MYCDARYADKMLVTSYRTYIADCMQAIALNTSVSAAFCSKGQQGKYIKERWYALVYPDGPNAAAPDETRMPEEVIQHIKDKLK